MECVGVLEEWLRSIVALDTKKHHKRGLNLFSEFMKKDPETLLKERRESSKRTSKAFNSIHLMFDNTCGVLALELAKV